ncbi:MAG: ABC-F family ATP-binding cassette domain-containing protein [Treponema sp.]|nr:ABC-F family ATP-binding cassette domain-containing protein [Treponema sp.]
MLLQIEGLYFSYQSSRTNIFEDFSLQLYEGWTCLAGSNGCGKSTLLKLIAGILHPDGGKIFAGGTGSSVDTVYCPQETSQIPENIYSVFWSDDNEIRRFFSMLHISEEMIERYDSLSGGEKKRIQIACALAEKPEILLLDEPTNHLDEKTVEMIFQTLSLFMGIGIMVSHDRSIADSLCAHTVYLYNESKAVSGGRDCTVCEVYQGGLSKALELREQNADDSRNRWNRLDSKAALEKDRSRRLAIENEKAKSRLSKRKIDPKDHDGQRKIDVARICGKDRSTGDAKARIENQIKRTEDARDSIQKSLKRKEGFSIESSGFCKSIVIEEKDLIAESSSNGIVKGGSYKLHVPRLEISPGEKISLTGQNGSGKSLFIKHVIGALEKSDRMKEAMYLPQEISEEEKKRVLEEFNNLEDDERGDVLSTLYRLGSEVESIQEGNLSPGELRKLMISLAVQKPLSLLILDEPTNHMDVTSVLALENALSSLSCSMLIVSHDKAFLSKVTDRQLHAERKGDYGRII